MKKALFACLVLLLVIISPLSVLADETAPLQPVQPFNGEIVLNDGPQLPDEGF